MQPSENEVNLCTLHGKVTMTFLKGKMVIEYLYFL